MLFQCGKQHRCFHVRSQDLDEGMTQSVDVCTISAVRALWQTVLRVSRLLATRLQIPIGTQTACVPGKKDYLSSRGVRERATHKAHTKTPMITPNMKHKKCVKTLNIYLVLSIEARLNL